MNIQDEMRTQLAVKFAVLFPHPDERQRRLLEAGEARVLGHGGVRAVARAASVSETWVQSRMFGQRARPVRRPGTGKPAPEAVHGVPPPTQHLELDRRGAELLSQSLTEREEKNSIAIASNEAFTNWSKTFTDPQPCAALVDRLTFNAPSSRPAPIPTGSLAPMRTRPTRTK